MTTSCSSTSTTPGPWDTTPLALSTGEDRPLGLFSYVLLLNLGLAAIALRQRWHSLVLLACAGTFVIELGWFARHLTPQKTLVGLIAFLLFGLLFLLLPLVRRDGADDASDSLLGAGASHVGRRFTSLYPASTS